MEDVISLMRGNQEFQKNSATTKSNYSTVHLDFKGQRILRSFEEIPWFIIISHTSLINLNNRIDNNAFSCVVKKNVFIILTEGLIQRQTVNLWNQVKPTNKSVN